MPAWWTAHRRTPAPAATSAQGPVSNESEPSIVRFEPLRPASRKRMLLAVVLGPFLWLVGLVTVAAVLHSAARSTRPADALVAGVRSPLILIVVRQGRVRGAPYAARG